MAKAEFSIAIRGTGPHRDPFITHAFQRWWGVTLYDRTERVADFIRREADLARSGSMTPSSQKAALRAEQALNQPQKADVTLTFEKRGEACVVNVSCPSGKSWLCPVELKLLFAEDLGPAFQLVDAAVERCLQSAATVALRVAPNC